MERSSETGSSRADLMLSGTRALHLSFLQGRNFAPGGSSRLPFAPHCSALGILPPAKPFSDRVWGGSGGEYCDRLGPIMTNHLKLPSFLSMLPSQQNCSCVNKEDWDGVQMVLGVTVFAAHASQECGWKQQDTSHRLYTAMKNVGRTS